MKKRWMIAAFLTSFSCLCAQEGEDPDNDYEPDFDTLGVGIDTGNLGPDDIAEKESPKCKGPNCIEEK